MQEETTTVTQITEETTVPQSSEVPTETTTAAQVSEVPTETTTEAQASGTPTETTREIIDYTEILERIGSNVSSMSEKLTTVSYFDESGISHFVKNSNNNDVVFLLLMIVIMLGAIFGVVLFRSFRK